MALDKIEEDYQVTGVFANCRFCGWVIRHEGDFEAVPLKCPHCRDQFAMAAPISIREGDRETPLFAENCARRYRWADAMLEARKK